ncbi:hypothetical protein GGQ19_003038 [Salinibacter ruber]|nr:hypothetical protein [Salinibacter ruber]
MTPASDLEGTAQVKEALVDELEAQTKDLPVRYATAHRIEPTPEGHEVATTDGDRIRGQRVIVVIYGCAWGAFSGQRYAPGGIHTGSPRIGEGRTPSVLAPSVPPSTEFVPRSPACAPRTAPVGPRAALKARAPPADNQGRAERRDASSAPVGGPPEHRNEAAVARAGIRAWDRPAANTAPPLVRCAASLPDQHAAGRSRT